MAITINGSGITTSEILDGTITNADINASAGIVGSKLSGAGKVLQSILSYTDTEVVQTGTASHIQIGLSATITPKSTTSLIDLSALIYSFAPLQGGYGAYVYRNGVNITPWLQQTQGGGSFTIYSNTSSLYRRDPIQWTFAQLGTGVAETYDIRVDVYSNVFNFQLNDYTGVTAGTASTLRLMEIEV